MIEAADANDRKLMVGLSQHFYGTSLAAKAILDSGELGTVDHGGLLHVQELGGTRGRRPQYRSRYHGGGMWLANGVHVVDRLTWVMGSQAMSVSAAIGTRAHYQAGRRLGDGVYPLQERAGGRRGVGWIRGRSAGLLVPGDLRERDAALQPATATGTCAWARGDEWEDRPFDDPPAEMKYEWKGFVDSIEQNIEPPTHGPYGRHIMEILFAAEQSAITNEEVVLESGYDWTTQTTGSPVNIEHGWV